MKKKLTDKQEKFAQLVVKYGNQSKAYREAYDVSDTTTTESVNVQASTLMANLNISLRVEEIREEAKNRNDVDIDLITKGLLKVVSDVDCYSWLYLV